jgi:hypothetical protein
MILDHNPVAGADNAALGDDHIVPNEKQSLFRILIPRMKVDARVSLDPDMVSQMNIPWPVDYHAKLDIDILPITPKEEAVLKIDERIPTSFLLHVITSFSQTLSLERKFLILLQRRNASHFKLLPVRDNQFAAILANNI